LSTTPFGFVLKIAFPQIVKLTWEPLIFRW